MPEPVDAASAADARHLLTLLDLTLLDPGADTDDIAALCRLAANPVAAPAAVCVLPNHVATTRTELAQHGLVRLPIATVVNFPDGDADPPRLRRQLDEALAAGADEIDAVLPYRALRAGNLAACVAMLKTSRAACGARVRLKVILETGELGDADTIARASRLAIAHGADFIKTSTGMAAVNATPAAAAVMLEAIRASGSRCGFKASGGIRRIDQALVYLTLAERTLGADALVPERFRIGASALIHELLAVAMAEPADSGRRR